MLFVAYEQLITCEILEMYGVVKSILWLTVLVVVPSVFGTGLSPLSVVFLYVFLYACIVGGIDQTCFVAPLVVQTTVIRYSDNSNPNHLVQHLL